MYHADGGTSERHAVTINQFLVRGSRLRNTQYAFGVVVFTGEQTKIRKNASTGGIAKSPVIDHITNRVVLGIFGLIVVLAAISTIWSLQWNNSTGLNSAFLFLKTSGQMDIISTFGTFIILYNTMIPISLYVTMEMIKLAQAWLINNDPQMYDPLTDTFAKSNTSSLNEDLGQVTYLFSDKTGTLTENIMIFRKLTAGGKRYDHDPQCQPGNGGRGRSNHLYETLSREELGPEETALHEFLQAMSLCHTAITQPGPSNQPEDLIYQASSPDEQSIVAAARETGYALLSNELSVMTIQVKQPYSTANPDIQSYQLLHVIEFTSQRKRMTTIYRYPNGRIVLLCKGADSIILSRLSKSRENSKNPADAQYAAFTKAAEEHIRQFASEGLRTLAYGKRELSQEEYDTWAAKYNEACTAIVNRQQKMDEVADEIETNLLLLGGTAIEDKLQDGVPDTLERLQNAGIRLWVLTGDKRETLVTPVI